MQRRDLSSRADRTRSAAPTRGAEVVPDSTASGGRLRSLLSLQQQAGNRATTRAVQAALTGAAVNDHAKRHADHVAEAVLRDLRGSVHTGSPQVVRAIARVSNPGMDHGFQPERDFEAYVENTRGRGSPLPRPLRRAMEPHFGLDFGSVRVHTDGGAGEAARSIGATGFTHGRDIYFGPGAYRPDTPGGRLLAHELAHVVQQSAAGVPAHGRGAMPTGGEALRHGADVVVRKRLAPELGATTAPGVVGRVLGLQALVGDPFLAGPLGEGRRPRARAHTAPVVQRSLAYTLETFRDKPNSAVELYSTLLALLKDYVAKEQQPPTTRPPTEWFQARLGELDRLSRALLKQIESSTDIAEISARGAVNLLLGAIVDERKVLSQPALAGLTGDPQVAADTTHQAPDPARGGFFTGGGPQAAPVPSAENASALRVKTLVDQAHAVTVDSRVPQDRLALYEVATGEEAGTPVTVYRDPIVTNEFDPNEIFIDGKVSSADVRQGSLGDCYFLGALTSIAARDPARIKAMIGVSGTNVTVEFFVNQAGKWRRQAVTVARTLAYSVASGQLRGAGCRLSDRPNRARWYTTRRAVGPGMPDIVRIHRTDLHEAALWVPLMEKAYARLAEQYGRYGDEGPQLLSALVPGGYSVIDRGGLARLVYGVFYGPDVQNTAEQPVTYEYASPYLLRDNRDVLRSLLALAGYGVAQGVRAHVTASMTLRGAVNRLRKSASTVIAETDQVGGRVRVFIEKAVPAPNDQATLKAKLAALRDRATEWTSAGDDNERGVKEQAMLSLVREITDPMAAWRNVLFAGSNPPPIVKALTEELKTAGVALGGGRSGRQVFAKHEYTVRKAQFRDAGGLSLAVTDANLDNMIARIDARQSTVQVQNPHGTSSAIPGVGPDQEVVGFSNLSLENFLRAFDFVDRALVRRAGSGL